MHHFDSSRPSNEPREPIPPAHERSDQPTHIESDPLGTAALPSGGRIARLLAGLNLRLEPPVPSEEFYPSREVYERHAGPSVLQGTSFASPRLYISGLAATTYHWRDIHERAHTADGGHSEVHCLRGHDKGFFSMLNVTHREWIADVAERAVRIRRETGRLPIIHGHSTGALAALVAAVEYSKAHPGDQLCAGLIVSSPPFELRQNLHRVGLLAARVVRRFSAGAQFWSRFAASLDGGGLDPDIPGYETPTARWLPVQMLLELEKLRPLAAVAARSLHVPVLVIHGTNDVMANWKTTYTIFKRIPTDDKEIVLTRKGRHSMMFGEHAEQFEGAIARWIKVHQEGFDARDERALRAEMLRCMHSRWGIPTPAEPPPPAHPSRPGWLFGWRSSK